MCQRSGKFSKLYVIVYCNCMEPKGPLGLFVPLRLELLRTPVYINCIFIMIISICLYNIVSCKRLTTSDDSARIC